MKRFYIAALLLLASLGAALAQPKPAVQSQVYSSWVQTGRAADIIATTTSFNEALGTLAPVAVVYNQGINWAYVAPSTTSISQVTVASGIPIPPGSCAWIGLAGQTNIAAIATGDTTLQIALGYGVPGSCGGSGGSGGGAVFGPTGVGVPANFPPVLIGGTADGTASGLMQPWHVGAGGVGFINCANCSGSGASGVDEATFTPGSPTVMAPGGGFFQTNALNNPLTNLKMGMWQFTANRAGFVNLRNASGTEIGTSAVPLYVQGQFWQALQPISGTVTALQGTTPWTTSTPDTRPGNSTITTQDVVSGSSVGQNGTTIWSGSPTAGSTYPLAINGQGVVRFGVTGTWTGTLTFEGSVDLGVTWVSQPVRVTGTSFTGASITANGQFLLDTSGLTNVRLRSTAVMTGTAIVNSNEGTNPGAVQVLNPIRIYDNVSGQTATIKPANTAPVAGDTSTVVSLNPNGTLPPFSSTPTFNCGTGCGGSGSANPSVSATATGVPGSATYLGMNVGGNLTGVPGTANGVKTDSSGVTQPVSGLFWPYSMGQQVAGASIPVVLPSAQQAALTPPTSVGISGNLPPFASTPTFNIGLMPSITGSVGITGTLPPFTTPPTVNVGTGAAIAPFSAYVKASMSRLANTTTYTTNTGWNSVTPTFFSFTAACRVNGGQVLIPQIDIFSSNNPTLPLSGTLWLFSGIPGTNISDNQTFAIASSDFSNLTGSYAGFPFSLTNSQGNGGASNSSTSLTGVTYHGSCASGTTTITGMVEVTNAYVPASGEILTVGIATVGTN
jgi:hypothetical protein